MARDQYGKPLHVGDLVLIPARVRQIFAGDDWSNVVVVPLETIPPAGQVQTLAIHGGQCELVLPPAAEACEYLPDSLRDEEPA